VAENSGEQIDGSGALFCGLVNMMFCLSIVVNLVTSMPLMLSGKS